MKASKKFVLLGLTMLMGLTSCLSPEEQVICNASLDLNVSELNFDAEGEPVDKGFVNVISLSSWTATVQGGTWTTITPDEGKGNKPVHITVQPNPYADPRELTIRFLPEDCDATKAKILTIKQAATAVELTVDPASLNYDSNGTPNGQTFKVTSNTGWNATFPTAPFQVTRGTPAPSYKANNPAGEDVTINTVAHNSFAYKRAVDIVVTAKTETSTVTVNQTAAPVYAQADVTTFASETLLQLTEYTHTASSKVVDITTNAVFGGKFGEGGAIEIAPVHYAALLLDDNSVLEKLVIPEQFNAEDGTAFVSTSTELVGNTIRLTVAMDQNTYTSKRTASFKVTIHGDKSNAAGNKEVSAIITVVQEPAEKSFSVNPTSYNFPEAGGVKAFNLTTNSDVEWGVVESADWFAASTKDPNIGSGDITVKAERNLSLDPAGRTTDIVAHGTYADGTTAAPVTITISQDFCAATLNLDKNELNFGYDDNDGADATQEVVMAGNIGFDAYDDTYALHSNAPWLTATRTTGSPNIVISVQKNTSMTERTATIEVVGGPSGNTASESITVNQAGCPKVAISVLPETIEFEPTALGSLSDASTIAKALRINVKDGKKGEEYPWQVKIDWEGSTLNTFKWANEKTDFFGLKVTTTQDNTTAKDWEATLTITAISDGSEPENTAEVEVKLIQKGAGAAFVIVNPNPLVFPADYQLTQTTTLTTMEDVDAKLTIPTEYDWIKSPASGDTFGNNSTIQITLEENQLATARTAVIRFDVAGKDGNTAYTYVTITQNAGAAATIEVTPNAIEVPAGFGSLTELTSLAEVKTNTNWTATIEGAPEWISFANPTPDYNTSGNGNFQLPIYVLKENTNVTPRTAVITFIAGEDDGTWGEADPNIVTYQITVTQQGAEVAYITPTPDAITIGDAADGFTINVESNTVWTAAAEGSAWITGGTTTNVVGNQAVTFNFEANNTYQDRTGYIVFSNASDGTDYTADDSNIIEVVVPVVQKGRQPFTVSPETITMPAAGGTAAVEVNISAADQWQIVSSAGWVLGAAVVPTDQTGNGSFNLVIAKNETKEVRTATVTVTNTNTSDTDPTRVITISQAAASDVTISVTPDVYKLPGVATSLIPQVITNGDLTTLKAVKAADCDWLEVVGTAPDFTINVTPNTTSYKRVAEILYTVGTPAVNYAQAHVIIDQEPQYIEVTPAFIEAPASGLYSKALSIISNYSEWTVETDAYWIVLPTDATGSLNGVMNISIEENEDESPRSADIVVTGKDGLAAVVTVEQAAHTAELTLTPDAITAPVQGGSYIVLVDADAWDWNVRTQNVEGFFTIIEGYDDFDVIVHPNTTGKTRTAEILVADDYESRVLTLTQLGDELEMILTPETLEFTADGGTKVIQVVENDTLFSTNNELSFELPTGSLLTVNAFSNFFRVTAPENTTDKPIVEQFIAKTPRISKVVTVTIAPRQYFLTVATPELTFGSAAVTGAQVAFQTNIPDNGGIPNLAASDLNMFTNASIAAGIVSFGLTENTTGADRVGTLTLAFGENGPYAVITVTQTGEAYFLTATPDTYNLLPEATAINILAQTNVPGDGQTWTVVENSNWITPQGTAIYDQFSFNGIFNILANDSGADRSAVITITKGTLTTTVTINQQVLPTITLTATTTTTLSSVGMPSVALNVTTQDQVSWTATTDAEWLTVPNTEQKGSAAILFSVDKMDESVPRSADIAINGNYLGQSVAYKVTVTQNAHELTVSSAIPASIPATHPDGYRTFGVQVYSTEETWSLKTSAEGLGWIQFEGSDGNWHNFIENDPTFVGNGSFNVRISNNNTALERRATIIIETPTQTRTIEINQQVVPTITATTTTTFSSVGMTSVALNVTTQAQVSWTATTDAEWLTVPTTEQKGSAAILFSVDEMDASVLLRSADIAINGNYLGQSVAYKVTVTQNELTVSSNIPASIPATDPDGYSTFGVRVSSIEETLSLKTSEEGRGWIQFEDSAGNWQSVIENYTLVGNAFFNVRISNNNTASERLATIFIETPNQTHTIEINQAS